MGNNEKMRELRGALEWLSAERGVDKEVLYELMNDSIRTSARKAVKAYDDVDASYDLNTGKITCTAKLLVVEEVENPALEIGLEKAQETHPDAQIGDQITIEIFPEDFGRIACQAARQSIQQGLRAIEKKNICDSFREQEHQLISGIVKRSDNYEVVIDFNQTEGIMRRGDCIPNESFEPGDHVTALLLEINSEPSKPTLVVSRRHPDFVVRLFEREVSEIYEGVVVIKGVAREAGFRSKISVYTDQPKVDPVGACVGVRGIRVKNIVSELRGEKVDIIQWDPDIKTYVANALKPARLARIDVDEKRKQINIGVTEDQLSLTIGKKGQNVRLATKLTGWLINAEKIVSDAGDASLDFQEQVQRAIDSLAGVDGISPEDAEILVHSGFLSLDGILAAEVEDIAALDGIGPERAAVIYEAAKAAVE